MILGVLGYREVEKEAFKANGVSYDQISTMDELNGLDFQYNLFLNLFLVSPLFDRLYNSWNFSNWLKCIVLTIQASGKEATLKKIRNSHVAMTLNVSFWAPAFLGIGTWAAASLASSHFVATQAVAAKSTRSSAVLRRSWCPSPGITC